MEVERLVGKNVRNLRIFDENLFAVDQAHPGGNAVQHHYFIVLGQKCAAGKDALLIAAKIRAWEKHCA